jgi:hypothetical protein
MIILLKYAFLLYSRFIPATLPFDPLDFQTKDPTKQALLERPSKRFFCICVCETKRRQNPTIKILTHQRKKRYIGNLVGNKYIW